MRKIKYTLGVLALALMLTTQSCEDKLEILPNSSLLTETAFRNVDDLQNALNSAYLNYNNTTVAFNSIFTDNTRIGIDNGGQQVPLLSLVMNPNNGTAANLWISRYTMINHATRLIEASDLVDKTGRQAEVNHILGQAYALRAFAHFELFQYFTPDYLDRTGLSVPAVDQVITVEDLPRNTVEEVDTLIESDLAKALPLLDASETNVEFITTDFITALKARKALFMGDYPTALTEADKLIAKYPLANPLEYRLMYTDQDNTEVIFKAARVLGNARPGNIWHFGSGNPFLEMSAGLQSILEDGDIRSAVLFNDERISEDVFLINKYPFNVAFPFLLDVKVFRVSEMYLIKAEAELRANRFEDSRGTLKLLKDARFGSSQPAFTYTSLADGLEAIVKERRLELAYEGHRWTTLKRLGLDLIREASDCAPLDNACQLLNNDRRFTLPIPAGEIAANPLMVQNPGY
ncbi:RagB/SusD family nutrient uptake outer membrane protein [uncultured Polaribacter sp.]|uniref:RagB/SusD family nutrient uptake outer membrane protein n=1 Tax=uncultured Polaribacter sp. TaxID=174711 RepID=UPI002636E454|nr:RagB/SusD family nutrient uptake outer membrane protein [uncultured Polaribacter sp.]